VSSLCVVLRVGRDCQVLVYPPVSVRFGPMVDIGPGSDRVVVDLPADPVARGEFLARLDRVVSSLLAELAVGEAVPVVA
jgi:hypothetical protein